MGWEDPLEKKMAAHSSILAWRITWTKEPDGLPFMELQSWTLLKQLSSSSMIFPLMPEETVHVFKGTSNKDIINTVKIQFLLYFILHKKEKRLNMFNTIRQEENSAEL